VWLYGILGSKRAAVKGPNLSFWHEN
jgi:hypothetical protein